jgi:periplasmic protein TonB
MSQLALPGPHILHDEDVDPFPRDRQFAWSAGTSLVLHGAALALLLITWHATPKVEPDLHTIAITLVKTDDVAPAVNAAPAPAPAPAVSQAAPIEHAAPRHEQAPSRAAKPPAPHVTAPAPLTTPKLSPNATVAPRPSDDITALLQEGVGGRPLAAPSAAPSRIAIRSSAKVSDDYLLVLQNWLARFQNYPATATAKHEQGKGVVGFTIARDGHVVKVWTDESTGAPDLDAASIGMVRNASPVPPLPKELPDAAVDFYFPVNYTLSNFQRLFQ